MRSPKGESERVRAGDETASVMIVNRHTLITEMRKDGAVVFTLNSTVEEDTTPDRSLLSLDDILTFSDTVSLESIKPVLERQITMNSTISRAGLEKGYGAPVGQPLPTCTVEHASKLLIPWPTHLRM